MRRDVNLPPKKSVIPKAKEKLKSKNVHEKTVKRKQEQGHIFTNSTINLEQVAKRNHFKQSLSLVSNHLEQSLVSGQNPQPEVQWILNLNDIINGQDNWNNDPAAATAYTYAYLSIITGKIEIDGLDPITLLTPETGTQRISLLGTITNESINPLEMVSNTQLAEEAQRQLKNEFDIVQLALLPKEQHHLFSPIKKLKGYVRSKMTERLVKTGARHSEFLDQLNFMGINEVALKAGFENTIQERLDHPLPISQKEMRQLIHQLAVGSIAEHSTLKLPEGVTDIYSLENLPDSVKKACSEENIAKIIKKIFTSQDQLQTIDHNTNIPQFLRSSIHPDLTETDCSNLGLLTSFVTINPELSDLLINIYDVSDLGELKEHLKTLSEDQITAILNQTQTKNILKNGPWDQPLDIALTFLEAKVNQAHSQEIFDLSKENLTEDFYKQLEPNQIAPLLIDGVFNEQELIDEGVSRSNIKKAKKEFIYKNKNGEFKQKTIVKKDDYNTAITEAEDPDSHKDQALDILIESLGDDHIQVIQVYKEKVRETLLNDVTTEEINQYRTNSNISSDITDSQIKLHLVNNDKINQFIDQKTGAPIISRSEYKGWMNQAKEIVIDRTQSRQLAKKQQELSEEAVKNYKKNHMTQETAEKIDSFYLAALKKKKKIKPEAVENASQNQKKEIDNFIVDSPPDHINLSNNYDDYTPHDWSILFQLFPDIAQAAFGNFSEQQQQEINKFITT
jgi:hypothetical protein